MSDARLNHVTASMRTSPDAPFGRAVGIDLHYCGEPYNEGWDQFLASRPSGHHVQTSIWGRLKGHQGYRAERVIAERDGAICGGIQLLFSQRSFGTVAYAAKGPVVVDSDSQVTASLLKAAQLIAREHQVKLLLVQPSDPDRWINVQLEQQGFQPSPVEVCPAATTKVDLAQSEEGLLAGLKQKTRYNLRVARRFALSVREGGEDDVATFYRLVCATGKRQQFAVFDLEYYRQMWRLFHERGAARLSLIEHEGEPLAAQLLICFGNTALYKMGAWSGTKGHLHPNELLHWTSMIWARDRGYRWYDLDGVSVATAKAILRGERRGSAARTGRDAFKLSFGGQVFRIPPAHDYLPNPVMRWMFRRGLPLVTRLCGFEQFVQYLRTRRSRKDISSRA